MKAVDYNGARRVPTMSTGQVISEKKFGFQKKFE